MNILLVDPPMNRSELYSEWDLSDVKSSSPPIGLLSIAAYARARGHKVSFEMDEPEVVAITAMTIQIEKAAFIAEQIKLFHPNALTVIGGSHVTACPEETLRRYPQFDFGVVGEGEIVFDELLNALSKQGDFRTIQGLVFKDGPDICVNPRRAYIEDLDSLPYPAYDLLPDLMSYKLSPFGTKSRRSIGLVTSRGCPGQCTFCDRGVFGRRFRCHSAWYIYRLMRTLDDGRQGYGVKDFLFYDDLFVANRQRLKEFCELIEPFNYTWSCCARADFIDKEMLPMMKRAGCHLIEYGIESGNDEVLRLMKKNTTKKRVYETIEATHEAGIQSKGNFIFGAPGETLRSLENSINFACALPLDYFQHTFFSPLPGSEVWDSASDYGDFIPDWGRCNTFSINFIPFGLSRETLLGMSKKAWLRFYLRPRIIWQELKKMNFNKLINGAKAFWKTITR